MSIHNTHLFTTHIYLTTTSIEMLSGQTYRETYRLMVKLIGTLRNKKINICIQISTIVHKKLSWRRSLKIINSQQVFYLLDKRNNLIVKRKC